MINYDRLSVFYHVVRCGGMAAAARKKPTLSGLNAISKQILLLEEEMGARLLHRSPFRLTLKGRMLFEPLPDIAETLELIVASIRPSEVPRFRIGVEDELRQTILLPAAVEWLKHEPQTVVDVVTGDAAKLHDTFAAGELDFLLTMERPSSPRPPAGTRSRRFGARPLVLLVRHDSGITSPDHFWKQPKITEKLAAPGPNHPVVRAFQAGLRQGGISWPVQFVTDSLTNVLPFVATGLGVGVTLDFPASTQHTQVRVLPLQGFASVNIACHWRTPETRQIRTALRIAAEQLKARK